MGSNISSSPSNPDNASDVARQIELARCGDREALLELLLDNQRLLGQHIAARIGSGLQTLVNEEDIIQETFVRAYAHIDRLRASDDTGFLAWLKTIANNQIRDVVRNHQALKRGGDRKRVESAQQAFRSRAADLINELSSDGSTPSQFVAKREAVDAIQIALASLSEDQRKAIRLHCFENLTVEQVAQQMNRSEGSVRGLIQRAKAAIRESLHHSTLWLSKK